MTIREMVNQRRDEINLGINDIDSLSRIMVELSVLMGNVGEEIVDKERAYHRRQRELMEEDPKMSMNKIELIAKDTDEYMAYQQARMYMKMMEEMVNALKFRCRAIDSERIAASNL